MPADPAAAAALSSIRALADPRKGAEMAAYHKTGRQCLGVANPALDDLARTWRAAIAAEAAAAGADPLPPRLALAEGLWAGADPLPPRLALAEGLWESGVFEARIAAAKLLTQARIKGDGAVWTLILEWVPQFDGWAIADAVASAAGRRLTADPSRLAELAPLVRSEHLWSRRAALVFTLPFARGRHPGPAEAAAREAVLGWAAALSADPEWFIQKAAGWWLRTLSRHDPDRVRAFLDAHGAAMKPFARREALRLID